MLGDTPWRICGLTPSPLFDWKTTAHLPKEMWAAPSPMSCSIESISFGYSYEAYFDIANSSFLMFSTFLQWVYRLAADVAVVPVLRCSCVAWDICWTEHFPCSTFCNKPCWRWKKIKREEKESEDNCCGPVVEQLKKFQLNWYQIKPSLDCMSRQEPCWMPQRATISSAIWSKMDWITCFV